MRLTLDSLAGAVSVDPRILAGITVPNACDPLSCVERRQMHADMKWAEEKVTGALKNNFGVDVSPTQVVLRSKSPTFHTDNRPVKLKAYSATANITYGNDANLPWSLQIATLEIEFPAFTDDCEEYEYADIVEVAGFCKKLPAKLEFSSLVEGAQNTVTLTTMAYNLAELAPGVQIFEEPVSNPQPSWLPSAVDVIVYTSVPSKITAFYQHCTCGTESLEPICGTCYALKVREFCYKTDGYWLMPDQDCFSCDGLLSPYEFTLKTLTPDLWTEVLADATVSVLSQRLPLELCFCKSNHRVRRDLGILEMSNDDIRKVQPFFAMRNPFGYSTPGANSAWASLVLSFGGMEGGSGVI
jgi:hypothetical protein